jgi:uncharacterized protein YlxW (UPF0749 family)
MILFFLIYFARGCPLSGGKVCQSEISGAMCQVHPDKEQTKHKSNYGNRERETEDNENQDLETENANLEKENEELKKEVEGRMNRKDKKTS